MDSPSRAQVRKLIGVANYQFGAPAGDVLFKGKFRVKCSRRTGRIRHVFRGKNLLATLRPIDGYLALSLAGARVLLSKMKSPPNVIVVENGVSEFIKNGGDVFAKHIVTAPESIRPAEEVIVTDEDGTLLGVGTSRLSGNDMKYFKRGVAVRVRKGVNPKTDLEETEILE
jgi:predicted RNA-binding protein (TIGR00451 family)